jgi:hypothetical protein
MRAFSIFIHHASSSTPSLMLEVVSDWGILKAFAEKMLAESRDRIAVEIREDDRLVFILDRNGVTWTRPEFQTARAGQDARYLAPPETRA